MAARNLMVKVRTNMKWYMKPVIYLWYLVYLLEQWLFERFITVEVDTSPVEPNAQK